MEEIIKGLPDKYRQVWELRYNQEKKFNEIAKRLKFTEARANQIYNRVMLYMELELSSDKEEVLRGRVRQLDTLERKILLLTLQGRPDKQISEELGITLRGVVNKKYYVAERRLGVMNLKGFRRYGKLLEEILGGLTERKETRLDLEAEMMEFIVNMLAKRIKRKFHLEDVEIEKIDVQGFKEILAKFSQSRQRIFVAHFYQNHKAAQIAQREGVHRDAVWRILKTMSRGIILVLALDKKAAARGYLTTLSKREREILPYLLQGKFASEISQSTGRKIEEVRRDVQKIRAKLGGKAALDVYGEFFKEAMDEGGKKK